MRRLPSIKLRGGNRRRKLMLASLLILILIILWVIHSLSGPAEGLISPNRNVAGRYVPPDTIHFTGKNFSLDYPATYKSQASKPQQQYMKEHYTFDGPVKFGQFSLSVKVEVYSVPGGDKNALSPYKYRVDNPKLYEKRVTQLSGSEAQFFTKRDGTDTTVYIQNKNLVGVLAEQGSMTTAAQADFDLMLNSWQWR